MTSTARFLLFSSLAMLVAAPSLSAQTSAGPRDGVLILSGAGEPLGNREVLRRFGALAGGPDAEVIYIPSAASSIRTPSGFVADLPESGEIAPSVELLEQELARILGVRRVRILHTRSRRTSDSEQFVKPLETARAVWIGYGNAGRLMELIGGTRLQRELEGVLTRGGVIGGNSAGAIVQGAFILRGRPDKPVLVAEGRTTGLGFLKSVAINPHLVSAKRELELVNVVDANPFLLGIGLEDEAGLVIRGDDLEVIGEGRAAIYDNELHNGLWYYWLRAGDHFNLREWKAATTPSFPSPGR
jgi:cyanophycinase